MLDMKRRRGRGTAGLRFFAVAAAFVALSLSAVSGVSAELPSRSTTESLRSALFGSDESAADLWTRFNTSFARRRYREAASLAYELAAHKPEILVESPPAEGLYIPVSRLLAPVMAENPALLRAYRQAADPEAEALVAEFRRTERPEPLERLRRRLPFAGPWTEALELLGDAYLDGCDYLRAADVFAELQAAAPAASRERSALWAAKEASALFLAGKTDSAERKIGVIRKRFSGIKIETALGRTEMGEFCNALAAEIRRSRRRDGQGKRLSPEKLASAEGWSFAFKTNPLFAFFRRKHPEAVPLYAPGCAGGTVYVTDGNELRAIGVGDGRTLWTWRSPRPGRFDVKSTHQWLEHLAPVALRPAVAGERVLFLRPIRLSETVYSVCCAERSSGRFLWQRVAWSAEREAIETPPVADGERAFVVVSTLREIKPGVLGAGCRAVICFRVETGALLWRRPLPHEGRPESAEPLGSVAPPLVLGESVFVLEGRGLLHCLDEATGAIRWVRKVNAPRAQVGSRWDGSRWAGKGDRIFIATGGERVECFDIRTGRRLWSRPLESEIRYLAAGKTVLFAVGDRVEALLAASGVSEWTAGLPAPAVGPGCIADDLLFVPTERALCIFQAEDGRVVSRLKWPSPRPMSHLVVAGDALVGLAGDAVCKFGRLKAPKVREGGRSVGGAIGGLSGEDLSRLFFADALFRERAKPTISSPTAVVGVPLVESPSEWVVYDPRAGILRCISARADETPSWEVPFRAPVLSIRFDGKYVYLRCIDRIEIRDIRTGEAVFSEKSEAEGPVVFDSGRALWLEKRNDGRGQRFYLRGYDAAKESGFVASADDLGLKRLRAWCWQGERVYILGDQPNGRRVYLSASVANGRLGSVRKLADADSRIRSVNFDRARWIAADRRLCIFAAETQNIYCYSFETGKRLWKSTLEDNGRPILYFRRVGPYLFWSRGPRRAGKDLYFGANEIASGRLRKVRAATACIWGKSLYVVEKGKIRAYEVAGSKVSELKLPFRGARAVRIDPFGGDLVLALANRQGRICDGIIISADLASAASRQVSQAASPRSTEIPFHTGPICADAWLDDWDRVRMSWQDVRDRRSAAGEGDRPRPGRSSAEDDLSARWRACATDEALCLVVVVHDDRISPDKFSDCPWNGDSVELALMGESFASESPVFCLALGGPGQCWAAGPPLLPDKAAVRFDPIEKALVYEMKLPWDWLRKLGIRPERLQGGWSELGFALVINDRDGDLFRGGLEWGSGLFERWEPAEWRTLRFRPGG